MAHAKTVRRFCGVILTTCCFWLLSLPVSAQDPPSKPNDPANSGSKKTDSSKITGSISGRLRSVNGQPVTGRIPVFLCDGKTGWPIMSSDNRPLHRGNIKAKLNAVKHTLSANGKFTFENIQPGHYRLIAQSWDGMQGIPDEKSDLRKDLPLVIHGCATVNVESGKQVGCLLKALGTAEVFVKTDPDEGHAFLIPTTKKPIGDFVLSMNAWQDFGTQALGMTHMHGGKMLVKGLPNNAPIYFCYMNYDNNPGVGGAVCDTRRERTCTLDVYATWSNGKFEPPLRLLPLVDYVDRSKDSLQEIAGLGKPKDGQRFDLRKVYPLILADPLVNVRVGNTGEWTRIDILAAHVYRGYRRARLSRNQRQK